MIDQPETAEPPRLGLQRLRHVPNSNGHINAPEMVRLAFLVVRAADAHS